MSLLASVLQWYDEIGITDICEFESFGILNKKELLLVEQHSIKAKNPTNKTNRQIKYNIASPNTIQSNNELLTQINNQLKNIQTLKELENYIENFKEVPICKTAKNVAYKNNDIINPDILVVSDIAQEEDDKTGIALSGSEQLFLKNMLSSVNIDFEKQVKVINFIIWRPPGNRTLQQLEIEICKSILHKHIELINPKSILFLGKLNSTHVLQQTGSIKKLIQQQHTYNNNMASFLCYPMRELKLLSKNKKLAFECMVNLINYISKKR